MDISPSGVPTYYLKKSKYIDFKVTIQYLWSRTENLRLQSQ